MKGKRPAVILMCAALLFSCLSLCSCGNNVVLNSDSVSMTVGDTYELTLTNANGEVKWSSSNEKVATVDKGKVSAVSKGEAVISAVTQDGQKLTCDVSVGSVEVTSIRLNKSSLVLKAGGTDQLEAKAAPADAEYELDWSSSDSAVAVVDDNGLVTAIGSGTAIIKCFTDNNKSASCSVTVKSAKSTEAETKPVTNEEFSPYVVKLYKGLPYYAGPSYDYEINGKIVKTTIYTIVAEEYDGSGNKWGKLKSGVGWICLSN